MGHDFLSFHDKHLHLHDFTILMIRGVLLDSCHCPEVRDFVMGWEKAGPGVIVGADFDAFVDADPQNRERLLEVLQRSISTIKSFGGELPVAYLERVAADLLMEPYKPLPAGKFLDALTELRNMLLEGDRA